MLTLFSRIRQFLVKRDSDLAVSKKRFDRITPVLGSNNGGQSVSACQSPRAPGAGRRSNRDRKSKVSQSATDTPYVDQHGEPSASVEERMALEGAIRTTADGLPDGIKQSYLTLLEALLTLPQADEQVDRIKALQIAVSDASRHANG